MQHYSKEENKIYIYKFSLHPKLILNRTVFELSFYDIYNLGSYTFLKAMCIICNICGILSSKQN